MTQWITVEESLKARASAIERHVREERERIIEILEEHRNTGMDTIINIIRGDGPCGCGCGDLIGETTHG